MKQKLSITEVLMLGVMVKRQDGTYQISRTSHGRYAVALGYLRRRGYVTVNETLNHRLYKVTAAGRKAYATAPTKGNGIHANSRAVGIKDTATTRALRTDAEAADAIRKRQNRRQAKLLRRIFGF